MKNRSERKMKKTGIALLTLIAGTAISFFLFTGCNGCSCSCHEHTFSGDWERDESAHWHSSTCGHDLISDWGYHRDNNKDNICDDCQYQMQDKKEEDPQADAGTTDEEGNPSEEEKEPSKEQQTPIYASTNEITEGEEIEKYREYSTYGLYSKESGADNKFISDGGNIKESGEAVNGIYLSFGRLSGDLKGSFSFMYNTFRGSWCCMSI